MDISDFKLLIFSILGEVPKTPNTTGQTAINQSITYFQFVLFSYREIKTANFST